MIREKFLQAFEQEGFRRIPGQSLLQPSIRTSFLFSVGFVDLLQVIEGSSVDRSNRTTIQRCFRHFDVEQVADDRHLSLFEMAGALSCDVWSLDDTVRPLLEFLTVDCGLAVKRLHVTYFGGDHVAGQYLEPDLPARLAYLENGIPASNMWPGKANTNIWTEGTNSGDRRSGICGPHSEVFVLCDSKDDQAKAAGPLQASDRFMEISNAVSITHRKRELDNGLDKLETPLLELAVGMERLEAVMAGESHIHHSPKLVRLREAILGKSRAVTSKASTDLSIVADHVRAITHILADGGCPGYKGRGAVLRRVFKRLLRTTETLGLNIQMIFPDLAETVREIDAEINPNIETNMSTILDVFDKEILKLFQRVSKNELHLGSEQYSTVSDVRT